MAVFCPVPKCETRPYADMEALRTHLKKAQAEGDTNHIELIMLEGWDEVSTGEAVVKAADLETT